MKKLKQSAKLYSKPSSLAPHALSVKFWYVFFPVFYQSAERFAGNMEVREDDYKSWGVSKDWKLIKDKKLNFYVEVWKLSRLGKKIFT